LEFNIGFLTRQKTVIRLHYLFALLEASWYFYITVMVKVRLRITDIWLFKELKLITGK
jgi:hypothetical protein